MKEYRLIITGVHYAANPDSVAGQPDTEEMHVRTRKMLSWVRDENPIVVLMADPTNPKNPDAVMAIAEEIRIGYVGDDWLTTAKSLLAQSDCGMLGAEVTDVEVVEHGWIWVTVEADELTQILPLKSSEIEWSIWMSDLPLLPPNKQLVAEQGAAYVLEKKLLPNIDHADFEKLKTYVNIWLKNSRHDLSREARQARSAYIERLLAAQNKEVRQLAEPLKRQRTSICGRAMLNERCQQWWPSLMATARVERLWNQWRLRNDNKLWGGLRWIDSLLRELPGELYNDIGKLDEFLSGLYYMNTPQKAFQSILALMILRELTCRELGIEMRPMAEAEYQQDGLITDPMEMPTTIGRVVEFGKTQCELPIQRQTIQMLAQWLRDDYEQSHSKEIETLAKDRQEMLARAIEKVVEKPTTVIPHIDNYMPQIQTQNIDLPNLPLDQQEQLENE